MSEKNIMIVDTVEALEKRIEERPAALLRRTVLTESSALLNRSVSLPLLFQQQILPQQRSLRL